VTKGPDVRYLALRPIQEMMSRVLMNDPRFLYGVDISGDKLKSRLGKLLPGNKWLSGDYKAATDNIAKELSERCVVAIAKATHMPEDYVDLLMTSLTGHMYTVEDPETGLYLETKMQARGQLMGSPTSFPILCLINFALIWESVYPNVEFSDLSLLVNGDDCLFQTNDEGYARWAANAVAVGLTPSVGKTYFDARFMVMNSAMFEYSGVDNTGNIETLDDHTLIPFVNTGLLIGLKRSGDREKSFTSEDASVSGVESLGARARKLIEGFEWCSSELLRQFFTFNEVPDVPLFIPEVWGGLGLPETPEYTMPVEEYLLLQESVKAGLKFYKLESEQTLSPYYNLAKNELIASYGKVSKEFDQEISMMQWHHIDEPPVVRPDGMSEVVEHWVSMRERLVKREMEGKLEFETIDWMKVRMGPPKEVAGVWMSDCPGRVEVRHAGTGAYTVIPTISRRNTVFVPASPPLLTTSLSLFYSGLSVNVDGVDIHAKLRWIA